MAEGVGSGFRSVRITRPHLSGIVAMVVAAAFSAWLIVSESGSRSETAVKIGAPATTTASTPTSAALTSAELKEQSRALGQPVFWAGAEPGRRYELTRGAAGEIGVRYLPSGFAAGDSTDVLTVATIPFADAYAATERLARVPGAVSRMLVDGALVYYRPERPATYLAYPNLEYVIEVHDPSPERARELALSGRIQPVS